MFTKKTNNTTSQTTQGSDDADYTKSILSKIKDRIINGNRTQSASTQAQKNPKTQAEVNSSDDTFSTQDAPIEDDTDNDASIEDVSNKALNDLSVDEDTIQSYNATEGDNEIDLQDNKTAIDDSNIFTINDKIFEFTEKDLMFYVSPVSIDETFLSQKQEVSIKETELNEYRERIQKISDDANDEQGINSDIFEIEDVENKVETQNSNTILTDDVDDLFFNFNEIETSAQEETSASEFQDTIEEEQIESVDDEYEEDNVDFLTEEVKTNPSISVNDDDDSFDDSFLDANSSTIDHSSIEGIFDNQEEIKHKTQEDLADLESSSEIDTSESEDDLTLNDNNNLDFSDAELEFDSSSQTLTSEDEEEYENEVTEPNQVIERVYEGVTDAITQIQSSEIDLTAFLKTTIQTAVQKWMEDNLERIVNENLKK